MPQLHLEIGEVLGRRTLTGPWGGQAWRAVAVLPAAPPVPAWTPLGRTGDEETYYAGPVGLSFHSGETEHYRDNLATGAPSIWLAVRSTPGMPELALATADPYEGEGMTEGGDLIEAVPMPPDIAGQLAAFVAEHHVERPFYKRKRDKLDPRKMGHGRPADMQRKGVAEDDE
jgi:hypothetical protein